MKLSPQRVYNLLPAIYRARDEEQVFPLRALVGIIAEQFGAVEENIDQVYENWFIETCEAWAVPYIADLVGYRGLHRQVDPDNRRLPEDWERREIVIQRSDVANTIRNRRRKGTLAVLELLARDAAGWPARAVEFSRLLGWTQHLNFGNPELGKTVVHRDADKLGRTVDLRDRDALRKLTGPFDETARTVDVRRISDPKSPGRYNLPSVGLFVWRLKPYPVHKTRVHRLEETGRRNCATFSIAGNSHPLYTKQIPEDDPTGIAGELHLPLPIRKEAFTSPAGEGHTPSVKCVASEKYYGRDKSLAVWSPGWPGAEEDGLIPADLVVPTDLSAWQFGDLPKGYIAVDPERGRLAVHHYQKRIGDLFVSYHYAFGADMGGGLYEREAAEDKDKMIYYVWGDEPHFRGKEPRFESLIDALEHWQENFPDKSAVVEIMDNGVYKGNINVKLERGVSLEIRAARGARPIIRIPEEHSDKVEGLFLECAPGSSFTLDGIMVVKRGIEIRAPSTDCGEKDCRPVHVRIRHCTLVPGWALHPDCSSHQPEEPSLTIWNVTAMVSVEHSIVGSIFVDQEDSFAEPSIVRISDSIVDATDTNLDAVATSDEPADKYARAVLTVLRSTVIGRTRVRAVALAEDSIFHGLLTTVRRQVGCMRFCCVEPGSRTPPRYHCVPNPSVRGNGGEDPGPATDGVRPVFNSTRYGEPSYCQLAETCPTEISRGAHDESEMGAFHDLYQPQRAANLRHRLDEYLPAGTDGGIIFAD